MKNGGPGFGDPQRETESILARCRCGFKIIDLTLYLLVLITRITLRLIYGKNKRDELILSGHFGFYRSIQKWRANHRWGYIWSKGDTEEWEPKVSTLLTGLKGELFIDIGSSVGYYTLRLADNFKEIIAVEPEKESFSKLHKNTEHLDNVRTVQAAISDKDGEATLHISHTIGLHTLTPIPKDTYIVSKTKTLTLKTLLEGRTASLVKVDTEGAELMILDGAPPELVKAWLIEAHGGAERKLDLEEKLGNMGYETTWITETHIYAYCDPGQRGTESIWARCRCGLGIRDNDLERFDGLCPTCKLDWYVYGFDGTKKQPTT